MEKERKKPKPFKVNEDRIYANKFYPYYFTEDLRVNVVPVKFYTRYQAKLTLKGQFGKDWHKYLKIATGRMILSRGWKFVTALRARAAASEDMKIWLFSFRAQRQAIR